LVLRTSPPGSGEFALAGGKAGLQLQHGLGVDLTHTALRDAENPADLCKRESLEVVEREDESFPLRHPADRIGQGLAHLLRLEDTHRTVRGIGDGVAERDRVAWLPTRQHFVESGDAREADLTERGAELVLGDTQLVCNLLVGGSTAVLELELGNGLLKVPGLGTAERGTQSIERSSSRIAPFVRAIAYVSNG